MAQINYFDDIFDTVSKSVFCDAGLQLREQVESYVVAKGDDARLYEVYNAETDKTEYKVVTIDSYKVAVVVNGLECDLDYEIKPEDIITVVFIPQSSGAGWEVAAGVGLALLGIGLTIASVGTVGAAMAGTAGLWGQAIMLGVGAVAATGIGTLLILDGMDKLRDDESSKKKDDTSKNLYSISGAQNQNIIGNRYPIVLGRHLVNPLIVGSPYHITHTKNFLDAEEGDKGQEFHVLYTPGYGPLRLTNFKLADTILAYNQGSESGQRDCILHGQLSGCDQIVYDDQGKSVFVPGDFTTAWKNNDVKLEILQAGDKIPLQSETDKATQQYGTIYNQSVDEKEVNANLLYVYDKEIKDVAARVYKGASVPIGFRNNSVRFAAGCAKKIQVELDFQSGYFRTRTYKNDDESYAVYNKIPLCIAVQWRYARPDEDSSDADSPDGWTDFQHMVFDDGNVGPIVYTDTIRQDEIKNNFGLSKNTPAEQNEKWVGHNVFSLISYKTLEKELNESQIEALIESGDLESSVINGKSTYTYTSGMWWWKKTKKREVKYSVTKYVSKNPKYVVKTRQSKSGYYTTQEYGEWEHGQYSWKTITKTVKADTAHDEYYVVEVYQDASVNKNYKADDYNINERRYVFEYEFNDEECRKMLNFNADTNYLDNIEVRVLRITPSYLDETGTQSSKAKYSLSSYQDLAKWSYLRTWKFDKMKFQKALTDALRTPCYLKDGKYYLDSDCTEEAPEGITPTLISGNKYYFDNSDSVKVDDYPERPFTEKDMNKFCYIGLQLKQDVQNTPGSTLNQLSVIAEGFHPNYIEYDRYELSPNFNPNEKYYKAVVDDNNRVTYTEISLTQDTFIPDTYYVFRNDKEWYPQNIGENWSYYHKYKNDFDETVIDSISKEEYEAGVVVDSNAYYKFRDGSDYLEQIRTDVFSDEDNIDCIIKEDGTPERDEDGMIVPNFSPMFKYYISDKLYRRYITSNSAAVAMYSLVGPHMGQYGRTYDYVDKELFAEAYEFYKDITDGTKQKYGGLSQRYSKTINLRNTNRRHTGAEMNAKGWDEEPGAICTTLSVGYDNSSVTVSGDPSIYFVMTPILDNGTILTPEQLNVQGEKAINGQELDYDCILAKFTGARCYEIGERYAHFMHLVESVVWVYSNHGGECSQFTKAQDMIGWFDEGKTEHIGSLSKYPINAVRSKCYDEDIYELIELFWYFDDGEEITLSSDYYELFLDILEQHNTFAESDGLRHVSFNCNGVVGKEVKSTQLTQKILLTARSYFMRSENNKWAPLIGRPNPYPVNVLNQRNCISKSNTKAFGDVPCGFQLSIIDETDNYSSNDFFIMEEGEDYTDPTKNIEPLNIDYVTDKWQLACLARFNLACRLYQRESYTRTVGAVGFSFSLGDTVLLQDDSLLIGSDCAARIVELIEDNTYIYGFTTDEPFEFTGEVETEGNFAGYSAQGCTVVQGGKYKQSRCITFRFADPDTEVTYIPIGRTESNTVKMTKGLGNVVLFSTRIIKSTSHKQNPETEEELNGEVSVTEPKLDDLVTFGKVTSMYSKAVIMDIKHKEGDKFDLSLSPYNEDLYHAGFGYPVFKSNMTRPQRDEGFEFNEFVTLSQLYEQSTNAAVMSQPGAGVPSDVVVLGVKALENYILFNPTPGTNSASDAVAYYKYELSKTGLEADFESIYVEDGLYFFSKDNDEYPEVIDMKSWKFRVKAVNANGAESENWLYVNGTAVNYNDYLTWKPATITVEKSIKPNQDGFTLDWRLASENYGSDRFEIVVTKDGVEGSLATITDIELNEYTYKFDRTVDGYPEADDIEKYNIILKHYTSVSRSLGYEDSVVNDIKLSKAGYGTWKVPNMSSDTVTKDVIDRTVTLKMSTLRSPNTVYYGTTKYKVSIKRKGYAENSDGTQGESIADTEWFKPDLISYPYQDCTYVEEGAYDSSKKYFGNVAGSSYKALTILSAEEFIAKTTHYYDASISIDNFETLKSQLYKLVIDGDEKKWVSVADDEFGSSISYYRAYTGTCYSRLSENNWDSYKDTDSEIDYVESNGRFSQTLPLYGQSYDDRKIQNTSYGYRIIAFNESGNEGDPFEIEATALCTSIRDIVYAHEHYSDLYVERLSAISANIGFISKGGFGISEEDAMYNYWALSDLSAAEAGTLTDILAGSFRVGSADQYLKVTPYFDENGEKKYSIELKAESISFTNEGIDFNKGTYIYDANDPRKRLGLTSSGIVIQVTEEDNVWDGSVKITDVGYIKIDSTMKGDERFNSLIITNSPTDLPEKGFKISNGSIYHFVNNVKDENGDDPENLNLSETLRSNGEAFIESVHGKGYYEGSVQYPITSKKNIVALTNVQSVGICGVSVKAGGESENAFDLYSFASVLGLTDEQVSNKVIKKE